MAGAFPCMYLAYKKKVHTYSMSKEQCHYGNNYIHAHEVFTTYTAHCNNVLG